MAGLTETGITIKSVDEIIDDMESNQVANIDADINTEADSILGQLNGIYGAALAEAWELLEEIYQSAYPDTASGQSLSYVSALTGAIRQEATKAELEVRLTGVVTTVVPAGTQFYPDGDPDSLFQTTADATIQEHGTPDYEDVTAQAVLTGTGTTVGETDDLVISTPVSGLTLVAIDTTNPFVEAFLPGVNEEIDSQLRTRREQALAIAGSSTVDAIRADLLSVTGVDSCTVFENTALQTDADNVPGKAIEVLVFSESAPDFDDDEVAAQIWASKPAGTEAYGDTTKTVTDTSGNDHEVSFSEPITVTAYVEVTLVKTLDGSYGTDAGTADSIAAWALRTLRVGDSLYSSDIINVVADLTGVDYVDISAVFVDDDATPSPNTELVISSRQLATIATGDVDVTST
jgi:uncharacterized phage protein gp47/JayE